MFVAENISYKKNNRHILQNCSVTLYPGVFTAIVGPNGAGKTTLLKILAHELKGYNGFVLLNGKQLDKLPFKEISRQRAVLPQHATLNFPFTIEQVIAIGRYPHLTTRLESMRIIDAVIDQTNLDALRGRVYQTLSGGEQQRVQLARVLAQTWDDTVFPKYLLLDEPTASLDIAQQHNIMELARQSVHRNMGVLAIVHDLNLAARYADNLVFMKEGRIVADGKTVDVLRKEIIEDTFSYPVELLRNKTGATVVCPLSHHDQLKKTHIKINAASHGKRNYT